MQDVTARPSSRRLVAAPAVGICESLVEVLASRASTQAERPLYTFIDDDGRRTTLTMADVDRRARAIAAALQARGSVGRRALLLFAPGVEYNTSFLACLYAGVVAVPSFPPEPHRLERTLPRLRAILRDADASLVLTSSNLLGFAETAGEHVPELRALDWIATDPIGDATAESFIPRRIAGSDLAFLQYTSGSTGAPKGVMVTHGSLMANAAAITSAFDVPSVGVGVTWLPPYHDMGLIGDLLQPIFVGGEQTVISPLAFLTRPMRWLQLISERKAVISGGPNFAYDLCARRVRPRDLEGLDLSHWRVAYCGAEPVRDETLRRFAEAFAPAGFRAEAFAPCYGSAEATLLMTRRKAGASSPYTRVVKKAGLAHGWFIPATAGDEDGVPLVSCGQAEEGHEIQIVDPETGTVQLPHEVGEIWFRGPSVAAGYWSKPDESAATFGARLADGRGPYLRTGDLGCLVEGELYVVGRCKDLIIIAGANHYPQDIEHTVEESHPALRSSGCAAFSVEHEAAERLVVAVEANPARIGDPAVVIREIRKALLLRHELHAYDIVLIAPRSIPKTSSGKIQRAATRAAYLDGTLSIVARGKVAVRTESDARVRTPTEQLLAKIACELLDSKEVDVNTSFMELGGDSLMAMRLLMHVKEETGVDLGVRDILDADTLAGLAARIDHLLSTAGRRTRPELVRSAADGPAPLSLLQEEIWFAESDRPGTCRDHSYFALRLSGPIDAAVLDLALAHVVSRHDVLRTTFPMLDDEPRALVAPAAAAAFERVSAGSEPEVQAIARAVTQRPFDLQNARPWRAVLVEAGADDHVIVLCMHHIIADFWSAALLVRELRLSYEALIDARDPALPELSVQYGDFARWERSWLTGAELEERLSYWEETLALPLPVLDLRPDAPRPKRKSHQGALDGTVLGAALATAVREVAKAHGATPFMVWLAAFVALLERRTHAGDYVIGSAVANRQHPHVEQLVGYFANMVPLRIRAEGDPTFAELVARVKAAALGAYAHADVPPEVIMRRVQRGGRGELPYRVAFLLQGEMPVNRTFGGASLKLFDLHNGSSNFDLEVALLEVGQSTFATFEYDTDLFEPTTIRALVEEYAAIAGRCVREPDAKLSALCAEEGT